MDIQVVMASGDPENPGFGQVAGFPSGLRWGRVIYQTIALRKANKLAKFEHPQRDMQVVIASGDPEIPDLARSQDSRRASFRRVIYQTIALRKANKRAQNLSIHKWIYRWLWPPAILKIPDLARSQISRRASFPGV
ncbi:hypothetical protein Ddc_18426 [Ditylenchus destructor]|nr:hypothetical protein Ddc_18426 [Ditylenchus destructor]